jgi:hypothetical protein
VKLRSDSLCWNRILRWILSSAVKLAAAVLWSFLYTTLCSVRRSLSLSFGFRPQLLSADDVFPRSVCVVTTLRTAALDTANEVAVWSQMLQLNAHQQSDQSPILQYFHTNCYQIQSVTHWHWHWHWHYTA